MDEGEGGYGESGDPMDQFHRNEAISAVADEGFLGEEDDDYEDLYNDVNVGEGFLQSLRKNDDSGFRNDDIDEKKPPPPPPVPDAAGVSIPGVGGGGEGGVGVGSGVVESRVPARVDGFQNQGFRGNEVGAKGQVGGGGGGGNANRVGGNGVGNSVTAVSNVSVGGVGGGGGGAAAAASGGTILFVGDLHWWTTDAELEAELSKYGPVKEVKFYDEKASGKSKGYCQVEFYEPASATSCKEGMNGHVFNGRPCVVAFASPFTVKKMGEAQINRNQQMNPSAVPQGRRGAADAGAKPGGSNISTGGNYQGGDGNRGYGRGGNWGRGNNNAMGNRGPVNPMRNRGGGMGGRGIMGHGGNGFGQGMGGTPPLLHPQSMMNQGFDPAFGGPMGRMGNYGGFPGAPTPPFSGILPSFPGVGGVGLPGVAPHVNPAFFGRGMPVNGMGMMPTSGMDGPNMGMWSDPNMGGWGGEEPGGDHQYGEVSHDRAGWPMRDKDRGSERDWSGSSERRYRDDRDQGYERDAPREKEVGHDHEWDRYADHHRYRDREAEHDDEWERGRSSRTHSKSRLSQEEEHHSRSRDADYGKRRRLTSE
uniref:RNA-binding motif protein, X-linked-like-2 n=1 Tax=Cajanus cajan TaxID=3821 RepID=A0A151S4S2_CAJCA|nr:RNA-binding motif protein, X-linked-like-2 [Cajanus cajan]